MREINRKSLYCRDNSLYYTIDHHALQPQLSADMEECSSLQMFLCSKTASVSRLSELQESAILKPTSVQTQTSSMCCNVGHCRCVCEEPAHNYDETKLSRSVRNSSAAGCLYPAPSPPPAECHNPVIVTSIMFILVGLIKTHFHWNSSKCDTSIRSDH